MDYCRERFSNHANFEFVKTNGTNLAGIADGSQDFVYSFDSFVHFNGELVKLYINEIKRVLAPGGTCFIHYSNAGTVDLSSTEMGHGLRGQMTQAAMLDLLTDVEVLNSETIDWGIPNIDAIVTFRK